MNTTVFYLGLYFLIVVSIGVWAVRRGVGKSLEGYLLGGRDVGPAVTALTLQTTSMSGYMFLGAGSLAYTEGYWGLWYAMGDVGGGVVNLSVLGRRMRKLSQILGAVTTIEYLEKRYPSRWVRLVAGSLATFLLFFYVLAQFIAGGKGLALVTGLPYPVALVIAVSVILLYTFLGGYLAVAYTDFLQSIVMLAGVLWILAAALSHVGGLGAANAAIADIDPSLLSAWGRDLAYEGQWGLALGAVLIFSVGYMGWPHVVTRHMAMRRPSTARKAGGYATAWNLMFVPTPYIIGILALLIIPSGTDPELAIFVTAQELLPAFALGLVMGGIMAAIMSTADSILLQTGSIAARDIYHRFINPRMNDRQMVWVSRLIVLAIGAVGYLVAIFEPPAVFAVVVFATAVLGSAFVPSYVAAVWWPKANAAGALCSMVVGAGVTLYWELGNMSEPTGLHSMLVGIVCSSVAMYAGTMLTQSVNPVPAHIREAMHEAGRLGPIPRRMLRGEDTRLAGEAADAARWLRE